MAFAPPRRAQPFSSEALIFSTSTVAYVGHFRPFPQGCVCYRLLGSTCVSRYVFKQGTAPLLTLLKVVYIRVLYMVLALEVIHHRVVSLDLNLPLWARPWCFLQRGIRTLTNAESDEFVFAYAK